MDPSTDLPKDDSDPGDAAYAGGSEGPSESELEEASGAARADEAAASAPGERTAECDLDERQDKLVDEGVEETFPASDPVSVKRIT